MALIALLLLPLLGGLAAYIVAGKGRGDAERWVTIVTLAATLAVLILAMAGSGDGRWMAQVMVPWVPSLGISINFALDGLSAALIAIAAGLGIICVMASWRDIRVDSGLFHACVCWTIAATIGVFMSFDLLVFVFFWEAMLIPSFMLIAIWGHGDKEGAALKFLIFNAVAGFGLLAAVFALASMAGHMTFNAFELAELKLSPTAQVWLLLGFSLAFLVKLSVPPFHAWLPDAHTLAPTAGSILLAGVLLKTGGYGLFRFAPMLFPDGLAVLAPYALALGAAGALYGGFVACGQTDAKRLVAYTSIAHMSIVLMGVAAGVHYALAGAAVEMVAHSFSASALFMLIGALYERTQTRDLRQLGGLQQTAPRFAAAFAMFCSALLALPGTANFVGEALVVVGIFQVNWPFALVALSTLIVSVVYATRLLKGVVFGEARPRHVIDLSWREYVPVIVLSVATLVVGLYPQSLIALLEPAIKAALVLKLP
ncbi:NADH dehydrogenase subunit M [Rhodopseudomonas faecalis]|uniref:NADH dehydrogenase subunit M n=1 Tax=Rhodopseudomonas faecalis TaxID=99655 RepID=A0A318TDV2_9BRAD|nr:NADH-quinone oxidoreductase subunit M [Rhodopseudomonas faecalis]PYF02020.1 NADH dehydrogenase subunit M [Rhodopseudomonas faecalis]TAH65185.1 MAG: NADH-quinone oxidoreductase subunit M [Rhodopseudomonas palustris]